MTASQWLKCNLCDRYYVSGSSMHFAHERGSRHIRRLENHPPNADEPAVVQIAAPPDHTRCDACNSTMTTAQFVLHCNTRAHLTRQRVLDYHDALLRTQANQRGIEVSELQDGIDFGVLPPGAPNPAPVTLQVARVEQGAVSLTHARTSSSLGAHHGPQQRFTITTVFLPVSITPQNSVVVQVQFDPHGQQGRFEDRLELVFQEPGGNIFIITRPLKAAIANGQDLVTLAPTEPYRRPRRAQEHNETRVIRGGEEPHAPLNYLRRLRYEEIPGELTAVLQQGGVEAQIANFGEQFMPTEGLNLTTFQQYWSNLVHAEHHQAKIDLSNFNRDDVPITRVGSLYQLTVPGLAEKRPSVLVGDHIKLHPHSEDDGVWFQGIVRQTENAAVRISFHHTFPYTPRARYDVKFILNPVPFRRMHHALQVTPKRSNLLFPEPEDMQPGNNPAPGADGTNLTLYNDAVGANAEQLQAVRRIVELQAGSPPFVVFGPPGTGKTVTIVESICQLLNNRNNRVLACAPSNPASDLIARRLITIADLQPDRLFRLNATRRPLGEFPNELLSYSLQSGGRFSVPALDVLSSYQVVVATCSSAALLDGFGVDPGAFTHIFVDEAGQGMEPEVMIPIMTMAGLKTNVILSGDPKQLGPVIQSPVARQLGLRESYLQRLMNLPAYDEVTMRGISVAKLLQNFRSHNSILAFPNQEFYSNELIASAPAPIANSMLDSGWNGLGAPNFPVIFEAVTGGDEREGTSPSYFNPLEASIVKGYVEGLAPFVATTRDIGIVTPYRGQVRKIKQLLRESNITDINIGSVEQFQGQERQVIIVSTVRSSPDLISFDLRHTLGFVANDQRLNVAITRAQALLIVAGDPQVLGMDRLWRRFMYYIHAHGGWRGAPFPWDPNVNPNDAGVTSELAEQELIDLFRRTGLQGSDDDSDDPDELDHAGGMDD